MITSHKLPWNGVNQIITGRRNPTPCEVNRGYGASHYREFPVSVWLKSDGTLKTWIKSPDDNLRYYR